MESREKEIEKAEELFWFEYQNVIDYQNHVDNLQEVRACIFSQYDSSEYSIEWTEGYWLTDDYVDYAPTTETDLYIDRNSELGELLFKYKDHFQNEFNLDYQEDGIWTAVNITGFYEVRKIKAA